MGYPAPMAPRRSFLPPETEALREAVVRRNAARLRGVIPQLRPRSRARWQREVLRALEAALQSLRGPRRREVLYGPEMRSWIAQVEQALALEKPHADPMALFDRVAGGPWLARLLPSGRMDRGFRRRARALGQELLEKTVERLPALVAGATPSGRNFGPLPLDAREDPEEGRRAGEIILPHAGPVEIRGRGRARILLEGRAVQLLARGRPRILPPPLIPGSGIRLTRRIRWTRAGLRTGPRIGNAARRLGEALALLDAAWPEAGREVRAQTFVVVPLVERGTVSYSLPERPGCSYINLAGKSLVDLADDLLHESAHHRLHGLEEIEGPLVRDDGEPRYWSPWRRAVRPVHGILHAAYTFAWRAALLERLANLRTPPLPRRSLLAGRDSELRMVRRSCADLLDAAREGLLTLAGKRLTEAIRRRAGRS